MIGEKITKKIKAVIKNNKLDHSVIAKKMGVSNTHFYQMLARMVQNKGNLTTLEKIVDAIDVDITIDIMPKKEKEFYKTVDDFFLDFSLVKYGGLIVVTFPDSYQVWIEKKGLSDSEYIARARSIRRLINE